MTITRLSPPRPGPLALLFCALALIPCPHVLAQSQSVNVVVRMENTDWNKCGDIGTLPDMYYTVSVNGIESTTAVQENCCEMGHWDVDQEVTQAVPLSAGSVPIVISQYDDDDNEDDLCDLNPADGVRRLFLSLDLATCQISGSATGSCNQSLLLMGDDTYFQFKIWVEYPVGDTRCLHDPIWPQPGQEVTVRATALDTNGRPPLQGTVDTIEILVGDENNVVASATGQNTLEYRFTPPPGSDHFDYFCRVTDQGLRFAGPWHVTQVGDPPGGRVTVPILYTGSVSGGIDFCFIPDRNSYSGPHDTSFWNDVATAIREAYYADNAMTWRGGLPFLKNQDKLNFWISLRAGEAHDADAADWRHEYPRGWDTDFSLCDAGVILHTNPLRDHANRYDRIFSADITWLWLCPFHFLAGIDGKCIECGTQVERMAWVNPFLHEAGHVPFGLADEYPNDGGYFQSPHRPNLFEDRDECLDDPLVTSGVIPSALACERITEVFEGGGEDYWYVLDPSDTFAHDLMRGAGTLQARPAELRRIHWLFNACLDGKC